MCGLSRLDGFIVFSISDLMFCLDIRSIDLHRVSSKKRFIEMYSALILSRIEFLRLLVPVVAGAMVSMFIGIGTVKL